ncbi:hypothetical protein DCC27_009555 [Auritidibacter sp. NML130574]|uniref:hypothetical protein n=1 Tax=Auritidibacter sp. NML130574 TaxID=2170745 RepID=UPI000D73785C|nr:hypothetical protein [Auritidibacter sp. NML130574]AXR74496.1 hypothetical protein DCC27_009555 [Auritidibacter sp. NML130574]
MAQLDEGNVLGGRYLITGQVLATAEQDVILTGLDQVLNREVMILVASPDHASQVATSARQLATGERSSDVQVLDLGLSDDRTYLISAGETDPQSLLSLVTGHEVYVEPFYTENLGSEIFGESRSYEPQTYDDDDEYYSSLDSDVAASREQQPHRSKFLNRISDRLNDSLNRTDDPSKLVRPGDTPHPNTTSRPAHDAGAGAAVAGVGAGPTRHDDHDDHSGQGGQDTDHGPRHADDESTVPTEPVSHSDSESVQTGPIPVIDDSDDTPEKTGQEPAGQAPAAEAAAASVEASEVPTAKDPAPQNVQQRVAQAMGNSATVGGSASAPQPATSGGGYGDSYAMEYAEERQGGGTGRWIGAVLLLLVLVVAVVLMFTFLGRGGSEPVAEPTSSAQSNEQGEQEPQDGESADDDASPVAPAPSISGISRVVPDSPNLSSQTDDQLPLAVDGDAATSWRSLSFAQSQFGGFARNLALVVELEEDSEITEVNIDQNGGSGGSFQVLVSDTENPADGTAVAEGSFTGPSYTASVSSEDGEPVTGQYVIINFTDLPQAADASPDLPYGLNIAEITVN